MQVMERIAEYNRKVTNPLTRPWAGWAPTLAIVEHVGRRSGKHYRTPVMVFDTHDGLAITLPYGPNRDWLKNVTAAGGGQVQRYGKTFAVTNPRIVPKAEAMPTVMGPRRAQFRLLPIKSVLLLTRG